MKEVWVEFSESAIADYQELQKKVLEFMDHKKYNKIFGYKKK